MARGDGNVVEMDVDPTGLLAAEDIGWRDLHALIDALTPVQAEQPGYYAEGWSAKDLLAHIGAWLAEAGVMLERIAAGTYRREEVDIDEIVPLPDAGCAVPHPKAEGRGVVRSLPRRGGGFWVSPLPPRAPFWKKKGGGGTAGQPRRGAGEGEGEGGGGGGPPPARAWSELTPPGGAPRGGGRGGVPP